MRKAIILLAVLGLAGSLFAADPIIGTWRLNVAKSQFGPDGKAYMKEQTNVVRELNADQVEVVVTGIGTNGSSYSFKSIFPKQGGAIVGAEALSAVLAVIGPGNWCFTALQNGKQVRINHVVVSKDGKSAQETLKSMDATGKITESLLVYDKQ